MNKKKGIIIALVASAIMAIFGIVVYRKSSVEKKYSDNIEVGINHLTNGDYEYAITYFKEAIEIKEKSIEARIYLAKSFLANDEDDNALIYLQEAQDLYINNEDLLKQIIKISKEIDTDKSYDFLMKFIYGVGEDKVSQDIRDIFNAANEVPAMPLVDNATGSYDGPISVRLKDYLIIPGHSYYYTTDGTRPTRNSQKYKGKIDISENTSLNIIGFNVKDESTSVITLDYTIESQDEVSGKNYGYNINEGYNDDNTNIDVEFNQEIALGYLIKRAGIKAIKDYNGLGEAIYSYKVNNSYSGYSEYIFSTIGDIQIVNGKKAMDAYISVMNDGTDNVQDVGAYIIYEDGRIEETSY